MNEEDDELNHLKPSEILFPPKVRLHLRSKSSKKVVQIHDNMNESIQESRKGGMTTTDKPRSKPNTNWQAAMVNHMKG